MLTPLAYNVNSVGGAKHTVRLTREFFAKQGSKGGKKAAENMTPAQRTIRAHKAAMKKAEAFRRLQAQQLIDEFQKDLGRQPKSPEELENWLKAKKGGQK
jgi:hypothetical protein